MAILAVFCCKSTLLAQGRSKWYNGCRYCRQTPTLVSRSTRLVEDITHRYGFWYLVPRPGKETLLLEARRIHSIHQLCDTILGARLDEELFPLLLARKSRDLLRTTLIETYFEHDLQPALVEQGVVHIESFQYSRRLLA